MEKRIHDFDQTIFISRVLIFFVEALNKKLWRKSFIFCNKTKTEIFLENRRHSVSDVENNFTKTKVLTNLI